MFRAAGDSTWQKRVGEKLVFLPWKFCWIGKIQGSTSLVPMSRMTSSSKLLKYEEVTDLAKKLAEGGLLPGERPIVVKENGQYIVLEGNRRICASKLLLNRELIPPEYRRGFPTITTADQVELLKKIKVDVSPDRRTAEPILTLRHTESGIKRWKPVARMRRVMRLFDRGLHCRANSRTASRNARQNSQDN